MVVAQVLIIAYGNPLRCDDGLAWRVAEELSRLKFTNPPAIHTCIQLTPELAAKVSQACTVLFIDAAPSGEPGTLVLEEIRPKRESSVFTHEFSPASIVELSEELYHARPGRALSLSIVGECFDHGESISSKVEENLPLLVDRIRKIVEQMPGRH